MFRKSSIFLAASVTLWLGSTGCGGVSDAGAAPSGPDAPADQYDAAPVDVEAAPDAANATDTGGSTLTPTVPTCPAGPEATAFAEAYAKSVCEGFASSCEAESLSYDASQCSDDVAAMFMAAVQDSCVTFDANATDQCLQVLRDLASQHPAPRPMLELEMAGCAGAFSGTVAPGGWCNTSLDCAAPADGGAICKHDTNGTNRCIAVHFARDVGAACDPVGDPVEHQCDLHAGLYCNLVTSQCEPLGEVGGTCEQTFSSLPSCVEGAACSSLGVCELLGQPGDACGFAKAPCNERAWCDATTNTCVAYQALGDSCAQDGDCGVSGGEACVGGICVPASVFLLYTSVQRTCVASAE
jgi:hypothetical protein